MTVNLWHVLKRFDPEFIPSIDCGEGWHQLIFDLDAELAEIDPNYTIAQIKEKFGSLRFYFDTQTKRGRLMRSIVSQYEKLSATTCEISGKDGVLMERNGYYKTYNMEHAPDGFAPVHRSVGTPLIISSKLREEFDARNHND